MPAETERDTGRTADGTPADSGKGPAPAEGAPEPADAAGGAESPAGSTGSTGSTGTAGKAGTAGSVEETDGIEVRDAVSAPDAEGTPRRTTRRFPMFTRDTARPEGGGRAAPGDAPAPARQWPILAVLLTVALGLLLTAFDLVRAGTILVGVALLAGAVMRWAVHDVGMLAVRSRFTDIVTYGVLGLGITLFAMMAQPDEWLELPFLEDTLHYTIRD